MKTTLIFLGTMALVQLSMAGTHFTGKGQEFTPEGKVVQSYSIDVTVTPISANQSKNVSTMKFDDGTTQVITQTIFSNGPGSWTSETDLGHGVGQCYGDMCTNYIQGNNGINTSTTIVMGKHGHSKDITYVLQGQNLLKVFKDNLSQAQ